MTEMLVEERLSRSDGDSDDDGLDHITCDCSDDMALCGKDLSEQDWIVNDEDGKWCIVCLELDKKLAVCPECQKKEVPVNDG